MWINVALGKPFIIRRQPRRLNWVMRTIHTPVLGLIRESLNATGLWCQGRPERHLYLSDAHTQKLIPSLQVRRTRPWYRCEKSSEMFHLGGENAGKIIIFLLRLCCYCNFVSRDTTFPLRGLGGSEGRVCHLLDLPPEHVSYLESERCGE